MKNDDKSSELEKTDTTSNSAVERLVMPAIDEVVAIRYLDNSTGDGYISIMLAYIMNDGIWVCDTSGVALLQYVGDEILEWWPLLAGTGNKAA